jgi:ketosteroid isomerase-like protein
MSQENIEVVQRVYTEVMGRGRIADPATMDLIPELFDREVEIHQLDDVMGTTGTFHGHEGVAQCTLEVLAVFKDLYFESDQHYAAGNVVVTAAAVYATGRASGVKVEMLIGHVWEVEDGRLTRMVVYRTPERALAAAGLTEADAHSG